MTKAYKIFTISVGAIAVLAVILGLLAMQSNPPEDDPTNNLPSEAVNTFREELVDRALARGPHPIEGFDATSLIVVFPDLHGPDFNGVTTGAGPQEGIYTYANNQLQWERSTNNPTTSAQQTITTDGYATLLLNLSQRLEMPATTASEAIAIVDKIDIPADIAEHIISKRDMIRVYAPTPLSVVSSPLRIWGEARGNWFFEADFQITLVDWDGRIIAESYASTENDWMTEEFVPYEGTIEFENPSEEADYSKRGTLILQKANPSGLSDNADALEIPVLFE